MECSADFFPKLLERAKPNSVPDPHLLIKLDSDPQKKQLRSKSDPVRSGSVATSAKDLTDHLIVCEQ